MNLLKSMFIAAAPMVALAAAVVAAGAIAAGAPALPWAGAALAHGVMLLLLGWAYLGQLPRTSANLPLLIAGSAVGVALSATALPETGLAPAIWAGDGLLNVVVYVFWYSRLDRAPSQALTLGAPLPDFELQTAAGETVTGADLRAKPSVLLFFRGNWCPLCMAQIREIAGLYREIDSMGAQVVLVSPQSHAKTEALAQRFDAPMRFLVDPDNTAARALGIAHESGLPMGMQVFGYDSDTVLPTMVVTDAAGTVVALDQTDNYRVRPEPSFFIEALRRGGVAAS